MKTLEPLNSKVIIIKSLELSLQVTVAATAGVTSGTFWAYSLGRIHTGLTSPNARLERAEG